MQALTDRTLLFIVLVVVAITMIFVVFTHNESGKTSFGLPKFALKGKEKSKKENDN